MKKTTVLALSLLHGVLFSPQPNANASPIKLQAPSYNLICPVSSLKAVSQQARLRALVPKVK